MRNPSLPAGMRRNVMLSSIAKYPLVPSHADAFDFELLNMGPDEYRARFERVYALAGRHFGQHEFSSPEDSLRYSSGRGYKELERRMKDGGSVVDSIAKSEVFGEYFEEDPWRAMADFSGLNVALRKAPAAEKRWKNDFSNLNLGKKKERDRQTGKAGGDDFSSGERRRFKVTKRDERGHGGDRDKSSGYVPKGGQRRKGVNMHDIFDKFDKKAR